jgi:membrane protease YdiL (CAAX protease family)
MTLVKPRSTIALAWFMMLLVSGLPNILWNELTGLDSRWMYWSKLALLGLVVIAGFFWQKIQPLRFFAMILLTIFMAEEIFHRLGDTAIWQNWFGGEGAPFTASMLSTQLIRFAVALVIIVVLLAMGYRRSEFFLVRGQLDAPIEPVRWLGFPKPVAWTRFGGQFALYISLGLLVFLMIGGRPTPALMLQALPMLPFILLFAAMNAFNEEMTYRASLLATLERHVGARHALWISAAFFGIGHYYGVPYGVIGVLLAGFLGWFLGKAMLETRGFFWAWFIHFLQDVLIFYFMSVGSITPGG